MNLLVSTVPRSGSTLLFNMCRLLFEQAYGKQEVYATWVQFFKEDKQKKHNIVKIHDRNQKYTKWSNKIITSIRDIRYIIASYSDFNKKFNVNNAENLKSVCNSFIRIMENNCSVANYIFKYEEYFNDRIKVINELTKSLELPMEKINFNLILDELEEIKNKIGRAHV